MKKEKVLKRDHVWLCLIVISPIVAILGVYDNSLALLGFILLIIAIKGIKQDIL